MTGETRPYKHDMPAPAGLFAKRLFQRTYKHGKSRGRLYQTTESCFGCVLVAQYLTEKNKSGFRSIIREHREIYAEKTYEKLQTEEAKEKLKLRRTTVKPAFAYLKEALGFKRFDLRTLQKVKGEFDLMCIAHNINNCTAC